MERFKLQYRSHAPFSATETDHVHTRMFPQLLLKKFIIYVDVHLPVCALNLETEIGMSLSSEPERKNFRDLDEARLNRLNLRMLLISGMGFFTDAYDLFVIGALLPVIGEYFSISHESLSYALISSSALIGAIVGPVIFGTFSDRFGRKFIYATDLLVLVVAAIGSSLSQNTLQLILWRFVLGVGIGGDYPVSATLMSEYSNRKDRGKLVASVFAMQGFGLLTGAGVALLTLFLHIPYSLAWRIPLALGSVPAIAVFYARQKIKETPRFEASAAGRRKKAERTDTSSNETVRIPSRNILSMYAPLILGTSISWFALDLAFYGTGIFSSTILEDIGKLSIFNSVEITSLIYLFSAFPGYWAAVFLIDSVGRRKLQLMGFAFMTLAYAVIAFIPGVITNLSALFVIYGSTFFFINLGPNTTTFVVPVEVFPTQIRTTGHGIAAAAGKAGASIGAFLFPFELKIIHISGIFTLLSIMGLLGLFVTALFIPEGQERRLEDISGEERLLRTYTEFSDLINSLVDEIHSGAEELNSFIERWGSTAQEADRIKKIEHDCDEIVHSVFVRLNTRFLAPINRMEIVSLTQALDDIMDYIEAVSARFAMYGIIEPTEWMMKFGSIIESCVEEVRKGISNINDIYAGRFDRIESSCIKVNEYENQADQVLRDALKELFTLNDAITIIKLKEIYDNMETVTDKCEDVADILRDLTVKYRTYPSTFRERMRIS